MLASSAMLLYGRRKNEFFAGWLYFSGRNADRQSFFCMLLKTLLPHLTISSLARLCYTVLWPRLCRFSFSCVLRHHKLKSSAFGCVLSNLACWCASKKWPCCFFSFEINKKDMKPFHIDRELECPILFKNVLSCLRTSYPVLERPNIVLEGPILFQNVLIPI